MSTQKISNLDDMRIDGEIDSEAHKEKRSKLITEYKKLLKKQEKNLAVEHKNALNIGETVKLLKDLYDTWKTRDIERKISFIKMAAAKLEVNKEKCLQILKKRCFNTSLFLLYTNGSPNWIRTNDPPVNSRLLYR